MFLTFIEHFLHNFVDRMVCVFICVISWLINAGKLFKTTTQYKKNIFSPHLNETLKDASCRLPDGELQFSI